MATSKIRALDGEDISLYSTDNVYKGTIVMQDSAVKIAGQGNHVLVATGNNLLFASTSIIGGATPVNLTIGNSGDTINLDATGVTYNLPALTRHSDVLITTPATGQVLRYSGDKWVNTGALVIDDSNRVGIGITPRARLHVYGSDVKAVIAAGSAGAVSITDATTSLKLAPGATRTATIGYYSCGLAFNHLYNVNGGTGYDTTNHAWIGLRLTSVSASELSALVFATKSTTGTGDIPAERMCILPDGKVGINKTSPAVMLDVASSSGNAIQSNHGICAIGTGTDTGFSLLNTRIFEDANGYLNITKPKAFPTIALLMDANGNVGIANTAPSEKLDVTGNIKSSATITGVDISGTNGTFSTSLKVGTNDVWHAGNFDPSSKLDASVQKYLSGVSGTCGGTITFAITNGTNITWNSAHTHAEQEAVTKVTALNSAGTSIGSYTASTSAGEVKIKAGTGITLGFSTDTITVNADHVPRSKVLTLNSSNSYSATFTHNYGSTNYVVLLGTDNPQRHVYYQKTANAVTVYLDDVPFASPTVEVSVMVQMATD